MKRFIASIAPMFLFVPLAFARSRTPPAPREQSLLARVTVYWASGGRGSDRDTRRHKCATGVRLRVGHCAVDPRRIPYGSKVIFPDGVFTAVDTGGAVINRKAARRAGRTALERSALVIDRFFETKGQALAWAKAHPEFIMVQVLPPNYRPPTAQPGKLPGQQPKVQGKQVAALAAPQSKRIADNEYLSAPFGRMRRH